MSSLPATTKHRLIRIPQIPHVWEGDIFPIGDMIENLDPDLKENGRCIVWVDGSEGFVRTMDVVKGNTGIEAMVRSLLKAIEKPQSPAEPARPHKVVVRDRELQFFLRGALQGLEIQVDYQQDLPLLDELWRNLQAMKPEGMGNIPPQLLEKLEERAIALIWNLEPWDFLAEYNLIEIQINGYNVESLYACVMGMMGQEFGVIFYRSLESMKKFRMMAGEMTESSIEEGDIERAFLQQDCWFVNFSMDEEDFEFDDEDEMEIFQKLFLSQSFPENTVETIFGSIHPYEGIRPLIDTEELEPLYLAIEAFGKFVKKNKKALETSFEKEITHQYSLKLPWGNGKSHKIKIRTMPEISSELEAMEIIADDELEMNDDELVDISSEMFPDNCIVFFADFPQIMFHTLGNKFRPLKGSKGIKFNAKNQEIPIIVIQTTRPKAKLIIEQIEKEKGIEYLFFTVGRDPIYDQDYDIAILKTFAGHHHIFAELLMDDFSFKDNAKKWTNKTKPWQGRCGVLIAMGATGNHRGNPQQRDILAFFETKVVSKQEAGLEQLTLNI